MTQEKSKRIESLIKNLSPTQMEELFKIFQRNKCAYTINNNGIFLNLSWLSDDMLNHIEQFITFCLESKKELDKYEILYQDLNQQLNDHNDNQKSLLFKEDKKETIHEIKKAIPRISSSMKYYLLKKKFSKNPISNNVFQVKDRLIKETPVLQKQ
jgi:hypothetical protein